MREEAADSGGYALIPLLRMEGKNPGDSRADGQPGSGSASRKNSRFLAGGAISSGQNQGKRKDLHEHAQLKEADRRLSGREKETLKDLGRRKPSMTSLRTPRATLTQD